MILQLELTNRCNFSCEYCLRNFSDITPEDFPLKLFEKIIGEIDINKLVLYGWGEPLLNKNFLRFLKIAKKLDIKTTTSTNASLLTPNLIKKLSSLLSSITISMHENAFKKISQAVKELNASISLIITKDNALGISNTIQNLCELGVKKINISHPIPPNIEIFEKSLFITQSKEAFEISKPYLDKGWDFIHDTIVQSVMEVYYNDSEKKEEVREYKKLKEKASKLGCSVNLPALLNYRMRLKDILNLQKKFEEIREIAEEYGVEIFTPEMFAKLNRNCEYIDKDVIFLKANGEVAPCMLYAYDHCEYLNFHPKKMKKVSYGNVKEKSLMEIWEDEEYIKFRKIRKNFNNIPWCGECVYSTLNCWYVSSNELDCYGNAPTCNECLFSSGIAKCIL